MNEKRKERKQGHLGYSENTVYQFGSRGIITPARAKLDTYDEINVSAKQETGSKPKCPVSLEHALQVI
jgi:hypothetical protein